MGKEGRGGGSGERGREVGKQEEREGGGEMEGGGERGREGGREVGKEGGRWGNRKRWGKRGRWGKREGGGGRGREAGKELRAGEIWVSHTQGYDPSHHNTHTHTHTHIHTPLQASVSGIQLRRHCHSRGTPHLYCFQPLRMEHRQLCLQSVTCIDKREGKESNGR